LIPDLGQVPEYNKIKKVLFRLDLTQLLKVGLTENHIRSGGVIIFFFFYIYDSLEDFGVDLLEKGEQYVPVVEQLAQSIALVIVFFIVFTIIALIISLIRTIMRYYNLHMYRRENGFVIESGLLNKKELAAKDEKIQIIKYSQNLLQSLTGIYELVMRQASSASVSDAKSIKVVGLSLKNIQQAKNYVLKSNYQASVDLDLNPVNFYFLFRRLSYASIAFTIFAFISIYNKHWDYLLYSTLFYLLALTASVLAYKKRRFGIGKELVKLEGGVFGNLVKIVEAHKIQNVRIKESPFQRRRKLSSLLLYTASGVILIPDIKKEHAVRISNYLIYKVESSRKAWM
jgi:putative membrane protein